MPDAGSTGGGQRPYQRQRSDRFYAHKVPRRFPAGARKGEPVPHRQRFAPKKQPKDELGTFSCASTGGGTALPRE